MKMISRRDFMKASAVVGAAGVLTACGGSASSTAASSTAASSAAASSEAASGSANVGVCIYQFADNFMTLYRTDLEEYLKDMGYAVTIVDGKNDQNTQTEQINTFLQQGVDVLIINPVQTTSAQTIVDTISPPAPRSSSSTVSPTRAFWTPTKASAATSKADARQSGTYQGELILRPLLRAISTATARSPTSCARATRKHRCTVSYRVLHQGSDRRRQGKSSACTSIWTTGIRPPHSRTLQTLWHSTATRSRSSSATTMQWLWALCSPSCRLAARSARTSIWSVLTH